jgi:hypothetical protein
MVGLLGTLVGAAVLVLIILPGLWLTWLSLRGEAHTPKALRGDEADRSD